MEEDLFTLLAGAEAVVATVPPERILWGAAAQGDPLPYIILNVISGRYDITNSGASKFWRGLVQIDCYARTSPGATALKRAVTDALNGQAGLGFQGIFLETASTKRAEDDGDPVRPFRAQLEFKMTHKE